MDGWLESLRYVESPEALFPLAATAQALLATAPRPGALLVAHSVLLLLAQRAERDILNDRDWMAVRGLCRLLADFTETLDIQKLDAGGAAWRDWTCPDSLQ